MKKLNFKKKDIADDIEDVPVHAPVKKKTGLPPVLDRGMSKQELDKRLAKMRDYNDHFIDMPQHQSKPHDVRNWLAASGYDPDLVEKVFD